MYDLPGGLMLLVAVGAGHVEPEEVGSRLVEEVLPAAEGLDFVELVFDEPVNGLDVCLPGVGTGNSATGAPASCARSRPAHVVERV